jgi:hypothetical protein
LRHGPNDFIRLSDFIGGKAAKRRGTLCDGNETAGQRLVQTNRKPAAPHYPEKFAREFAVRWLSHSSLPFIIFQNLYFVDISLSSRRASFQQMTLAFLQFGAGATWAAESGLT